MKGTVGGFQYDTICIASVRAIHLLINAKICLCHRPAWGIL